MRPVDSFSWLLIVCALCAAANGAQADPNADLNAVCANYDRSDAMIPMRDGIELYTEIYRPKHNSGRSGILMTRTPYESIAPGQQCSHRLLTYFNGVRDDGYVIVIQSIRGRYKSEGVFELLPPPALEQSTSGGVNQTTDAWDSIDWLVKNVSHNNGKVALLGVSYDAWLALMAALEPHPALVAVSVQASRMDQWIGDDFWRNGALRLDYAFEYAAFMELSHDLEPFPFDTDDMFEWYLRLGSIKNVNEKYFRGRSEFWNKLEQHRVHDEFWQPRTPAASLSAIRVPILVTAGWWDAEDFYGPMQIFKALTRGEVPSGDSRLVVGPWTHGSWTDKPGRSVAKIDFGSDTGVYWVQEVERPWLAHWLLDKPAPDLPAVLSFRTGSNQWQRYNRWPPRSGSPLELYLTCDGSIAIEHSTDRGSCRKSYISDPANPIPYLPRPIGPVRGGEDFGGSHYRSPWSDWEAQDQRFSTQRPDTLVFATAPLLENITLSGEAELTLHVATTGSDGDFIVKLLDIYPSLIPGQPDLGGYHLMLDHIVLAGRYLNDTTKAAPLKPGHVYELKFRFIGNDHAFLKGHRLAVQVQSTLFPVIARNPQTFVENTFEATAAAFKPARIDIVFDRRKPNLLTIPSD